ncbi:hypothetical protein WA026_021803 [Henosepilachna vigintioctopunctata]|uniref:CRAL-TRIO domain-containing protein n=1 Tax=Henosepilachna vigintioctopunctata TaxID=420089 RepID=A0AAW1TP86_9CUCU
MDITYLSENRTAVLAFCQKSEQDMKENVLILREWMKKQPHIPSELLSDDLLEIHIIKNKFSIEKVKSKIENYCSMKNKPQTRYLLENYTLAPSAVSQFYIPMPILTDDYNRIFIEKILDEDRYDMRNQLTNTIVLREFISRYDYSLGEIHIVDMRNCSMKLITKLRANVVADAVPLVLKCHSARIKEIHIVSKLASTLTNWCKPLLPAKIASRFHAHDDVEMLSKILPPKCLPKDYGGELKSLGEFLDDFDEIYAKNSEKLKEYVNTVSREDLRQGGPMSEEMQGTFKKLNID